MLELLLGITIPETEFKIHFYQISWISLYFLLPLDKMNKNKIDIDTLHGFGIITEFPKFLMYYIGRFAKSS